MFQIKRHVYQESFTIVEVQIHFIYCVWETSVTACNCVHSLIKSLRVSFPQQSCNCFYFGTDHWGTHVRLMYLILFWSFKCHLQLCSRFSEAQFLTCVNSDVWLYRYNIDLNTSDLWSSLSVDICVLFQLIFILLFLF